MGNQDTTVVVLEDAYSEENQEVSTTLHSVMTRTYTEAMKRATHFIENPPQKKKEGWRFSYRVGVYSLDGGFILNHGSPPMDERFGAG